MLTELRIENFAIIDRLELAFHPHLTTFTGETGAGKSIILDALEAVAGGKTDLTLVRSGTDKAQVEAVFRIPETSREAIAALLDAEELHDDPNYVTLARELRREGRSVARINGRAVNVNLLRELGEYLIDIHGQSEHLSLLNVRQHLGLLDRYASLEAELADYQAVVTRLHAVRRELNELRKSERDAAQRAELLSFQVNEIQGASLQPGEDDELQQERERLANAENLTSLTQQAVLLLDEGTPENASISDLLGQVVQHLAALSRIEHSQAGLYDQGEQLADLLSDLGRNLRLYLEQVEANPRRLEQVEERLDVINNLKRKYGGSIEAVQAFGMAAAEKLHQITHAGERIAELEEEENGLLKQVASLGVQLTEKRRAAAEGMQKAVEAELNDLSMVGARFTVDFHYDPDPHGAPLPDGATAAFDKTGLDRVEFLIAPNPGEGFKPLVKIASGGETSRLMLALKNVLAGADHVPTLIFDEIDQGIGGRVGSIVGEKLWQLARRHQVLCVTHLPQLAAFGDQHWHVHKDLQEGRTLTRVENLVEDGRVDELSKMMGSLTDTNRAAARELLQQAHQRAGEL